MSNCPVCRYQITAKHYDSSYKCWSKLGVKIHRSYRSAILWLLPKLNHKQTCESFGEGCIEYDYKNYLSINPLDDGSYSFEWNGGSIEELSRLLTDELSRIEPEEEYMWPWDLSYQIANPVVCKKVIKKVWVGKRVKHILRYHMSCGNEDFNFVKQNLIDGEYYHIKNFYINPNCEPFWFRIELEERPNMLFGCYYFDVYDELKNDEGL